MYSSTLRIYKFPTVWILDWLLFWYCVCPHSLCIEKAFQAQLKLKHIQLLQCCLQKFNFQVHQLALRVNMLSCI